LPAAEIGVNRQSQLVNEKIKDVCFAKLSLHINENGGDFL